MDVQAGIIVDVDGTTVNRTRETDVAREMIGRVEDRFEIRPEKLIGDTAYGSASMLGWLVEEKGIEPHVPVWEKGQRSDGTFSRFDFLFDPLADTYVCPGGKLLKRHRRAFKRKRTGITKDNTIIYRASQSDCQGCAMKARCCPNTASRKLARSLHESARDVARRIATTAAYGQSRKDRKKVEVLFAHMKRILKMDRLRLRGMTGAKTEFLLTATAQNLRRMAKFLGTGPPRPLAGAVP